MKLWRWFVGQVARLRRPAVDVSAPGSEPRHADDHLTAADEPAPGPPAHWVERVRRGAPGLLEPSLRRRDGPVEPPPARRVALSQTELDPLEEPERGYVRTEPTAAPLRPEAPVRRPLFRKLRAPLLRQALRRTHPRPAPNASDEVSPASARDHVPHELDAAASRVGNPGDSPAAEPNRVPHELDTAPRRVTEPEDSLASEPDRRRVVAETGRTPAPLRPGAGESESSQGPPIPDKPEHPPGRSEVVAFEAPVQRRAGRSERAAGSAPPLEAGVARPPAKSVAVDEILRDRAWERAVPSPAPRPDAERLHGPVSSRPTPPQEASVEPGPSPRRRADPLSEADAHPWPELPPPLAEPDSDVEAALRAWEHRRRLDFEQTRL